MRIQIGDRVRVLATENTANRAIAGKVGEVTAVTGVSAFVHFDGDSKLQTRCVGLAELKYQGANNEATDRRVRVSTDGIHAD